jgi:hypothetical protein
MTLSETSAVLWKHSKLDWFKFFQPIRIAPTSKGYWLFIMIPSWYNGHFSMRSINKYPGNGKIQSPISK